MTSKFVVGALAGTLALFCAVVDPARAATIYSYTGNAFTDINDATPPNGTYTTSMNLVISFTLASELGPNFPYQSILASVQSFSAFDGRNTITNLNYNPAGNSGPALFNVGTDAAGNINAWVIRVQTGPTLVADLFIGEQIWTILSAADTQFDLGQIEECTVFAPSINGVPGCLSTRGDNGSNLNNLGSWSVVNAETPLPAALPLFVGGLGLIGLLAQRRKKKTPLAA